MRISTAVSYLVLILCLGPVLVACDEPPTQTSAFIATDKQTSAFAATDKEAAAAPNLTGKGILRSRLVRLDGTFLKQLQDAKKGKNTDSSSVMATLNLFEDFVVAVEVEATPDSDDLNHIFAGQVFGQPTSLVTILLQQGILNAVIRLKGRVYRVRSRGNGIYRIEEAAAIKIPDHDQSSGEQGKTE